MSGNQAHKVLPKKVEKYLDSELDDRCRAKGRRRDGITDTQKVILTAASHSIIAAADSSYASDPRCKSTSMELAYLQCGCSRIDMSTYQILRRCAGNFSI